MGAPTKFCQPGFLFSSQRLTSAAKPTLKHISWRAVPDPRLASPLREIWGTPQYDAAFADLERSADAVQHVDPFQTLTPNRTASTPSADVSPLIYPIFRFNSKSN